MGWSRACRDVLHTSLKNNRFTLERTTSLTVREVTEESWKKQKNPFNTLLTLIVTF